MNKEIIDLNVDRAIFAINNNFDFNSAKDFFYKAFDEVGSKTKLAYFDIISRVLQNLRYNVRGFSKKMRVKECYTSLLSFIQSEFVYIEFVDIDPNSEMDMGLCNSICCDIINNIGGFVQSMRKLYLDIGIITALANNKKYLNTFMPIILKCEQAAAKVLKRFNNPTPQIRQNITIWEEEVRGKYGAKYL